MDARDDGERRRRDAGARTKRVFFVRGARFRFYSFFTYPTPVSERATDLNDDELEPTAIGYKRGGFGVYVSRRRAERSPESGDREERGEEVENDTTPECVVDEGYD